MTKRRKNVLKEPLQSEQEFGLLYKIAKNTCIDIGRKKNKINIQPEQFLYELTCSEQGYEDIQESLQLRQLVKGLPEKMQEIVILRFSQELTMREIADIVNLPMRTVQSQLRSALKILKREELIMEI